MSVRAEPNPSFEELHARIERLPEGVTGEILEPPRIETMGRPGKAHRRAAQECFFGLRLRGIGGGEGGWWIEQEAEIRFGQRLLVPDLAGWRVERVAELPDENPISVVPDWVCEVLSPATAGKDRHLKLPLYAREGVAWVWLVDPELRLLEVYESVDGRATLAVSLGPGEQAELVPFGIVMDTSGWWLVSSEL